MLKPNIDRLDYGQILAPPVGYNDVRVKTLRRETPFF